MKRNVNKQTGFTIVELVVVIILLGILAATALPRFINVDEQAHQAAFDGVVGGFQAGVALYHAQWVADGQPAAGDQIPEFGNLRTTGLGYPYSFTDNATDIPAASQDCVDVMIGLLQSSPSIEPVAAIANVAAANAPDFRAVRNGADCQYYYTADTPVSGQDTRVFTYESATGIVTGSVVTLP